MEKEMSEALVEFYHQILQPEFAGIHAKLTEHDERFREIDGHFDQICHRFERVEQEQLMANQALARLDAKIDDVRSELKAEIRAVDTNLTEHRRDTEAHGRGYLVSE